MAGESNSFCGASAERAPWEALIRQVSLRQKSQNTSLKTPQNSALSSQTLQQRPASTIRSANRSGKHDRSCEQANEQAACVRPAARDQGDELSRNKNRNRASLSWQERLRALAPQLLQRTAQAAKQKFGRNEKSASKHAANYHNRPHSLRKECCATNGGPRQTLLLQRKNQATFSKHSLKICIYYTVLNTRSNRKAKNRLVPGFPNLRASLDRAKQRSSCPAATGSSMRMCSYACTAAAVARNALRRSHEPRQVARARAGTVFLYAFAQKPRGLPRQLGRRVSAPRYSAWRTRFGPTTRRSSTFGGWSA